MLTVLSRIGVVFGVVLVGMLLFYLGLSMFCAIPTGDYHVGTAVEHPALVARVYQDMLFRPDRVVFEGSPANAWQLYFNLTSPTTNFRTADLMWVW